MDMEDARTTMDEAAEKGTVPWEKLREELGI